ncbi:MAG: hypothetical protein K0R07_559 [Sedimentibacter sp.]|jgi:hypothetical protein|nr:hypothetical protein [Sedimentibacter sp.]
MQLLVYYATIINIPNIIIATKIVLNDVLNNLHLYDVIFEFIRYQWGLKKLTPVQFRNQLLAA